MIKTVHIAHWVTFCLFRLPQTSHIIFVCVPRGFLFDMIHCNKMFLFMPVHMEVLETFCSKRLVDH